MPTLIPAVHDALVTQLGAALEDVEVFDGEGANENASTDIVMVGVYDPDSADSPPGATSQQNWATTGGSAARDDNGIVWCTAVSWTGDDDPRAARISAFATVAQAETVIRDEPTLGVAGVLWSGVSDLTMRQTRNSKGAECQVTFAVHYRGRI